MAKPKIKSNGRTITVRVPISITKRGGRKIVLAPDGTSVESCKLICQQADNAMVKALARAFRWRNMLETDIRGTIAEIAADEQINESYVSRLLRLTLLAPDIIEAVIGQHHSSTMTLATLMRPLPIAWEEQRLTLRTRGAGH